jgi:hypothetical protein
VFALWPPWTIGSSESANESAPVFSPVQLQRPLPFTIPTVKPGPHWVYVWWNPRCKAFQGSQDLTEGDFFSSGVCDGKCDPYERGKGVPFFDASVEEDRKDIVVRLNTVLHTSPNPVPSICE